MRYLERKSHFLVLAVFALAGLGISLFSASFGSADTEEELCDSGTQLFAGACWQSSSAEVKRTAPQAARICATEGGSLPEALALAAFAEEPGITLDAGEEWSSDIPSFSGENLFSVITVSAESDITSALSSSTRRYRCVIPYPNE